MAVVNDDRDGVAPEATVDVLLINLFELGGGGLGDQTETCNPHRRDCGQCLPASIRLLLTRCNDPPEPTPIETGHLPCKDPQLFSC
jgi:hypothetical protein